MNWQNNWVSPTQKLFKTKRDSFSWNILVKQIPVKSLVVGIEVDLLGAVSRINVNNCDYPKCNDKSNKRINLLLAARENQKDTCQQNRLSRIRRQADHSEIALLSVCGNSRNILSEHKCYQALKLFDSLGNKPTSEWTKQFWSGNFPLSLKV